MLARPSSAIFSRASVVAGAVELKASYINRFFFRARGGFGRVWVLPEVAGKFIKPPGTFGFFG